MPTTILGLLIFTVAVVPGLSWQLGRESRHPTRQLAGFRETVSLIFSGLVVIAASLALFGAVRWIAPAHTPDVGELLREPGNYIRQQLPYLAAWLGSLIGVASVGAYIGGRCVPRSSNGVTFESAWWKAFGHQPDTDNTHQVHVGCELIDGSYIAGMLWTYSSSVEETADRDLGLAAPITYRSVGHDTEQPLAAAVAIIASTRIKFVTVTYLIKQS